MIESFLASWALFRDAHLTGWIIAALLAAIGVVVVARDRIFLGAAVAQASTFGIALGMWLAPLVLPPRAADDLLLLVCSSVFAIAAAWVPTRALGSARESDEALAGWVFLAASSAAILLMAKSPHGMEEVHRLLASSLIGATRFDVALFAALGVTAAVLIWRTRRSLLLYAMEPEMAEAVGVRIRLHSTVLAVGLGFVTAQAIRVSGTLYAFGCLVLPTLAARCLGRTSLPLFWKAPALALAVSMASSVLADHYDLPPAQLTVALLAGIAALTGLLRRGQAI